MSDDGLRIHIKSPVRQKITLNVCKGTTIKSVKEAIEFDTEIPSDLLILCLDGKRLEDDYVVQNNAVLCVFEHYHPLEKKILEEMAQFTAKFFQSI